MTARLLTAPAWPLAAGAVLLAAAVSLPAPPEEATAARGTWPLARSLTSRSHHRTPGPAGTARVTRPSRAATPVSRLAPGRPWLTSARRVFGCESGWNPRAVSPSGTYRGLAQMDATFWRSHGGLRFASRPDLASVAEQLAVAYDGWRQRGWSPWPTCGRLA